MLPASTGVGGETYEQTLRGLFTIGTSSLASEKSGKGQWQTGIDSATGGSPCNIGG